MNGFGATQMKGTPPGGKLFVGRLGRKEEAGALVSLEGLMFGKR